MKRIKISILLQILSVGFLTSTLVFSQTDNSKNIYFRISVIDKRGQIINNLKKENIKIREGKIEQEISYFSDKEEPASVAVLLDISDSVELKARQAAVGAALKFVQAANNQNDYSLIAFGQGVYPLTNLGSTDQQVIDALNQIANIKLKGENTNLYDACSFALEKLEKGKYGKKILLIFSDGMNNSSEKSFNQLERQLKTSDVLVYSISIVKPSDMILSQAIQGQVYLDEMSNITGGKSFYPQTPVEIDEIVERIAVTLKSQYVIGYQPKENAKKDNWRSVEIKAEPIIDSNGKKTSLTIYTRKGYYTEKVTK